MARLRFDAVKGALASALGSGDTTISSPGLARLGNVNSPDVALVCLYAADAAGNITTSENVYVTSHVAGTTTATVTRAGDGTTAQAWVNGSQWTHGFGVADVADVEANAPGDVTSVNGYTGTVTLAASDVGALGATAAAGGDLSGSYPGPTVAQLQGKPVASTAPTDAQLLVWNGSQWAPVSLSGEVTITDAGVATVAQNVINIKAYGAVGNGTHDDAPAINAALVAAALLPNSIVQVPVPPSGGKWRINSPIIVPPQTTLRGTVDSYPFPFYGGSGSQPSNYLYVDNSFSGAAAIILPGAADSSGAWSLTSRGQGVEDLFINFGIGASAPSGNVDGVQLLGNARNWTISNVGVMYASGNGFAGVQSSIDLTFPIAGRLYRCVSLNAGLYGFKCAALNAGLTNMNGMTDAYITDCYATSSALDGFYFGGMENTVIDNCRAEWNLGNGFRFSTANNFAGMTVGTLTTDNNCQNGVLITTDNLAGVSPLLIDSLKMHRDGRNATVRSTDPGTGGGAFAGVNIVGHSGTAMPPIIIDDLVVAPGIGADGITPVATTLASSPIAGATTFSVASATGIPIDHGTYAGSLSLNSGSLSITIQSSLSFVADQTLTIWHDNLNYMVGNVTSYNSGTGALVINIARVVGTTLGASLTGWTVGMMLYLTSSTTTGTDSGQVNEFVMVSSVSGTTVTTLNPLTYGYNGNGSVTNGSANAPQRGINIINAGLVSVNGGRVHGDAIGFRDNNTSTKVRRGPNILEATGLWSAAVEVTPGFYSSPAGGVWAANVTAGGSTPATNASRYAGATASGAPGSGSWFKGDFIIDQTGLIWVCTTAGTPGPWIAVDSTKLPTAGGTMSGAIAMGAHKITGLTNGSASDDAAAFGQIPTALPPNGSAGGDLTGTYPNPTLAAAGTAGTYTKVTTDSKGRVTSGTTLAAGDIPNIAESQVTGLASDLAAKAPLKNSGISYVSGASPANTRRSTLSFGAPTVAPTSGWQDICSRVSFTLPVTPTRCRLRITNSSVLAGTTTSQSVAITGVYWGTPAGSEATWAGDFTATPTTIAGLNTTQDLSTELVTSWFTPPASAVANAFQAISIGYTSANDSKVNIAGAPGWSWHGTTGTGCAAAAGNAAVPGVGTQTAYFLPFDIRMEFEFVGSNQIGLFIGDSLTNGYIANPTGVGKMGPDSTWPQMAANRMGALAINAGVNGSTTSGWTSSTSTAWTRFDLSTCVPDFAVVSLGINQLNSGQYLPNYQADILTIVSNLQTLGIKRIYLTTTPPYTGLAGSNKQAIQAGILKATINAGSLGTVTIVGPVTGTTAQGGPPGAGNPGNPTDWYQSGGNFTVASCTNTNLSPTLTTSNNFLTASTYGVQVGSIVTGTGIPAGTYVKSVDSATQITLSQNCTGGSGVTITFNQNLLWFEMPTSGVMEGPFAITAASGTSTLSLTVSGTTSNTHFLGCPVFVGAEGFRQKINDWILNGVPGVHGAIDFADIAQMPGSPAVPAALNPAVPFSTQHWRYYPYSSNAHPQTPALYARWAQAFASSVLGQ